MSAFGILRLLYPIDLKVFLAIKKICYKTRGKIDFKLFELLYFGAYLIDSALLRRTRLRPGVPQLSVRTSGSDVKE